MILIIALLMAGLLSLLIFIYCRVRSTNRSARAKALQEKAISTRGRSRILLKKGSNSGQDSILKTTGFGDDEYFFHNN